MAYPTITEKPCSVCGESKDLDAFNRRKDSRDGLQPKCKVCERAYKRAWKDRNQERARITRRAWRIANPEAYQAIRRRDHLKYRYGLTEPEYLCLFETQDGCCALCETPGTLWPNPGHLKVDHCHETGVVRGLLCTTCNLGLGMLGDNSTGLERALAYLRRAES